MKKFIQQQNQYLLENHPTLWNTKIIWMLGTSLILHILFFIAGLLSLIDPETLQEYRVIDNFYGNGVFLLGLIISIVLLVVWMIAMFRNNAFNNFYPFTRVKLFKHFLSYFVIFIATTTFYYSFTLGMQAHIAISYDDERMEQDITLANKAIPLLPFEMESYELDRLRQPAPFDTLYCATGSLNVDKSEKHHEFKGEEYQFYTLKKVRIDTSRLADQDLRDLSVYNEVINNSRVFYVKDQVSRAKLPFETAAPSFYNFSDVFYERDENRTYYSESIYEARDSGNQFNQLTIERTKQTQINQQLLMEGEAAVKTTLDALMKLSQTYQIKHNISVSEWMQVQSYKPPYLIVEIIEDGVRPYSKNSFQNNASNTTDLSRYIYELRRSKYFDASGLRQILSNVHELKNTNIFEGSLHVFLRLAFAFSVIVFMYRVTGLKPLLFSIVTIGLLGVFTSLIAVFVGYLISFSNASDYLIFILVLTIGSTILISTLGYYRRFKKLIAGILINITMVGIVPYMVLIIAFISEIQEDTCPYSPSENRERCNILWDLLGVYWSYLFLALGLAFIFWFCKRLMLWRAMPEG
jgi:hypothetical protein